MGRRGGGATKYTEYWNLLWAFSEWIGTYDNEQYPERSWNNFASNNRGAFNYLLAGLPLLVAYAARVEPTQWQGICF
jgi:hypothetical protein